MSTVERSALLPTPDGSDPHGADMVLELRGAGMPGSLVGGKAAALDRLIGWGMPVPPTAVVTAHAFRVLIRQGAIAGVLARLHDHAAVSDEDVDAAFLASSFGQVIEDEIVA